MNNFDKYRRMIKLLFGLLLTLALSGIYWLIFEHWLNHIIWAPFWRRGIWMMVFIYTVLLAFFLMIYGGYRIGVLRVGNLIYSQTLALFFANFITYPTFSKAFKARSSKIAASLLKLLLR